MKNTIFEKLGLSLKQIKIYRTLLKFGSAGVAEIARETKLYRHDIYKEMPDLLHKGLVAQSPFGKRTLYVAESPHTLNQLIEKMQRELQAELPALMDDYSRGSHRPHIRYLEGSEGIRFVFRDLVQSLKKGDTFYRYESPRDETQRRKYIPQEYFDRFRDKAEVDRFVITNESTQKKKRLLLGRYVKAVPKEYDLFDYEISEFIYGNKVAFIDFKNKVASIIESEKIVEFQKKIFKLLFEKL